VPWYESIAVNGFLSVSGSINANRPPSRTNQLRVFDVDDRTFQIDVVELIVQRPISKPGEAGFRVDATAGAAIPKVLAATGLFRDENGAAHDFDIPQVFISYIVPVGRGLRIDAGKFYTMHGFEAIEGFDNHNDNATHSFLFGYALPGTHTGVKATYAFSDKVSGLVYLTNGWDNVKDNNSAKSLGAQMTVTPNARFSLSTGYMGGPERTGDDADARRLVDVVASYTPSDRLKLGLNYDYGHEANLVPMAAAECGCGVQAHGDATWQGIAGYARMTVSGQFALSMRGEWFDDTQGVRTGAVQRLTEFTVTPEYRVTPKLIVRGDIRIDRSNQAVFETRRGVSTNQPTARLNVLFAF
jgi:hypothetical protein